MRIRTRLNVSPTGKGRLLLLFHVSQLEYVENEFISDLLCLKDCAIYYTDFGGMEDGERPGSIQMIVILITDLLLDHSEELIKAVLKEAHENSIPLVPVLKEAISLDRFETIFGQTYFITRYQTSKTEIPYYDKMRKLLDQYLLADETREDVIVNFRKKIFLSYRKADRSLAIELMKKIHSFEGNYDVAIWFDEMLTAGDDYNMEILEELKDSDLFLLLFTPNVLEKAADGQDNYVKRIEIPAALENKKTILAVEMSHAQQGWETMLGLTDSCRVSLLEASDACARVLGMGCFDDMSSDRKYLLGLAYLDGILVEKDIKRGIGFLEKAANEMYEPAIREMKDRFLYGNTLPRDHEKSFSWLEKLLKVIGPDHVFYELEVNLQSFLEAGAVDTAEKIINRMCDSISEASRENGCGRYHGMFPSSYTLYRGQGTH